MSFFTRKEIFPIAIILFVIAFSAYIYPFLPELVPSHWNAEGEIDDWSGRGFTVLFFPGLILAVYLLMTFIPLADPLKKNYESFTVPYYWFRTLFVIFFSALYFYTIWTALGGNMNINYFVIPATSILFILIGAFLPKIKKNYFVGLKTPWTLASEENWNKTHAFGGKVFVAVGLLSLLISLFFKEAGLALIAIILVAVTTIFVYSYLIFKNRVLHDEK
jgi:uncharacterized membrane protein